MLQLKGVRRAEGEAEGVGHWERSRVVREKLSRRGRREKRTETWRVRTRAILWA